METVFVCDVLWVMLCCSVLKIPADDSIPAFVVEVVVDPVSREAQKLSAILHVLRQSTNVEIRLYMNCKDKLSEMPLKK